MADKTLDFNELCSTVISDNFDIATNDLQLFYYPYHLYVEERISNDFPRDSKTNLYDLYDAGIDNLEEDDWKITVGEEISSHTQIYLTDNYSTIVSNFLTTAGDFNEIHYDDLISQLSGLENLSTFDEMSASVMKWINDYVNDFSINQNPENADDSNLILTQAVSANIQTITENILNKVFRNLIQLVRFKRDYRMYGPNSTFYGNCYNTNNDCKKYTAIPASCFVERTNNYIVGNKAYEDTIPNTGGMIQNSVWHISPRQSYAIAKHVHGVSLNIDDLDSTVEAGHDIVLSSKTEGGSNKTKFVDSDDGSGSIPWGDMAGDGLVCDFKNGGGSVISSGSYSYSWNSNSSYCQLVSKSDQSANPWESTEIKLPTFSMRTWVWEHNDTGTNIVNPTEYM